MKVHPPKDGRLVLVSFSCLETVDALVCSLGRVVVGVASHWSWIKSDEYPSCSKNEI